jgi:hypothetical protein
MQKGKLLRRLFRSGRAAQALTFSGNSNLSVGQEIEGYSEIIET